MDAAPDPNIMSDASPTDLCDSGDLALCLEFEGNTDDSSMALNNAQSTEVAYVAGRVGMAIQVDEMSSIAILETDSLDLPDLTIEGWIRPMGDVSGQVIFDNNAQYILGFSSGGLLQCGVVLGPGNGRNADGGTVSANVWTHIACSYNSTTGLTTYINGCLAAEDDEDPLPAADRGNDGSTVASNNNTFHFIGDIDTLRIWNRALSAAEIVQIIQNQ